MLFNPPIISSDDNVLESKGEVRFYEAIGRRGRLSYCINQLWKDFQSTICRFSTSKLRQTRSGRVETVVGRVEGTMEYEILRKTRKKKDIPPKNNKIRQK